MTETVVDARGQLCPKPLILTKQALNDNIVGTAFAVIVDNATSRQNVERFLVDNAMAPEVSVEGSEFTLRFTKGAPELASPDAEAYCAVPVNTSYVITLDSEMVGRGPEELGRTLMTALLGSLKAVSPLPSHVMLYSSAVLLAVDGSPFVDALRDLEERGVEVLICGTCANYYDKVDEIHVGTVSNMLVILETLATAGKIIAL